MKRRLIGISLLIALTSVGSSGVPAVAQVADPCSDLERAHEFDFWIGEWEVFSDGKLAGTNSIRPILDGCVLQEMWSGAQGGAGSSLNFYNPRVDKWQQFWVWRNGTTLNLSGAFEEGRMVLQGDSVSQSGKRFATGLPGLRMRMELSDSSGRCRRTRAKAGSRPSTASTRRSRRLQLGAERDSVSTAGREISQRDRQPVPCTRIRERPRSSSLGTDASPPGLLEVGTR